MVKNKKDNGNVVKKVGILAQAESGAWGWEKAIGELFRSAGVEEEAVQLMSDSYKAGLSVGRNESPLYAIIPMSILEDTSLSANSKILYAEIMALAKKTGKCYATNKHLAERIGLKTRSIPRLVRELSGNGLVITNITRTKDGTYRNITVSFFSNVYSAEVYGY